MTVSKHVSAFLYAAMNSSQDTLHCMEQHCGITDL